MNLQKPIRTIIPDIDSSRSFPFREMSGFIYWNTTRHDVGRSEDPVCNDIFKKSAHKTNPEVEKVERKNSNSVHLTYSNSNQFVSNQVKYNRAVSNHISAHRSDSNHVRFDPANSTNTIRSPILILIFIFYVTYYHGLVVHMIQ